MNDYHDVLSFAQGAAGAANMFMAIISLTLCLFTLAGMAVTFAKAGKPGWGILVPIYNVVLMLQIAGRPVWWIFLFLIPVVNVLTLIVVSIDIATAFGKGPGFGLGLAFLGFIFFSILAFGDAEFDRLAVAGIARASTNVDAQRPAIASSKSNAVPQSIVATKDCFESLGVSIIRNFHGRGTNVGIGRGSAIMDEHLPALIPLNLDELYLSRTQISDVSLPQFAAMGQLQVLDVSSTNVSRDGIRQLKESLPDAKIFG